MRPFAGRLSAAGGALVAGRAPMTAKIAGVVAGLAFLMALPGAASAFASRCSAAEAKAAGKKASCKASVHAAAAAKNVAPDPLKLERCEGKFAAAWGKAQAAGDCASAAT